MTTAKLDEKRRLVMPPELRPRSAVTIQQVDADTWLVRRHLPETGLKMVMLRTIKKLPDDPVWERRELALARSASAHLPEPR
jgi:hypothetical protein